MTNSLKESFYYPAWERNDKLKALTIKDEKSILKAQEALEHKKATQVADK